MGLVDVLAVPTSQIGEYKESEIETECVYFRLTFTRVIQLVCAVLSTIVTFETDVRPTPLERLAAVRIPSRLYDAFSQDALVLRKYPFDPITHSDTLRVARARHAR